MRPRPPKTTSARSAYGQGGGVENRNLCHVSAGRPVIAHIGGKLLAASCEVHIWTRSGRLITGEPQQFIQTAIEARLGDDLANRQQHSRHVGFAARGAMGDGQRLTGNPKMTSWSATKP